MSTPDAVAGFACFTPAQAEAVGGLLCGGGSNTSRTREEMRGETAEDRIIARWARCVSKFGETNG